MLRPFYRRLRATGKPAKVALVAAMHKLLLIFHAVYLAVEILVSMEVEA